EFRRVLFRSNDAPSFTVGADQDVLVGADREARRIVHRGGSDAQCLSRAGVVVAAAVDQYDVERRTAGGIGGRGEGQRAGRGQGRRGAEGQRAASLRHGEIQGLQTAVV